MGRIYWKIFKIWPKNRKLLGRFTDMVVAALLKKREMGVHTDAKGYLGEHQLNQGQAQSSQHCPYLEDCTLLKDHRDNLPGLVKRFREHYCVKNHHLCARRWIRDFLGTDKIPELMMPQQHDWAEQLLMEAGVKYSEFQEKYRLLSSPL